MLGRGHSPDFLDVGEVRDGVLAFASDAAALQYADALELESFAQVCAACLLPGPVAGRLAAAAAAAARWCCCRRRRPLVLLPRPPLPDACSGPLQVAVLEMDSHYLFRNTSEAQALVVYLPGADFVPQPHELSSALRSQRPWDEL